MKPIIFQEQIQELLPLHAEAISFNDYKIDYSQFLGSGYFGRVYALVPRPDHEKNILSRWLPYFYDWAYPVKDASENKYCIKISYYFIESLFREIKDGTDSILCTFWEKGIQNESAILRKQYGVSRINIYVTDSWRSQIKSRVNGHTLDHYMQSGELLEEKNYLMRKAFVDFLWAIASTSLKYNDLDANNIMYDSVHQEWEIVDGSTEKNPGYRTSNARVSFISTLEGFLLPENPKGKIPRMTCALLKSLFNKAIETVSADEFSNRHYDAFVDRKCLLKAKDEVRIPKEFHFLTSVKKKVVSRYGNHEGRVTTLKRK